MCINNPAIFGTFDNSEPPPFRDFNDKKLPIASHLSLLGSGIDFRLQGEFEFRKLHKLERLLDKQFMRNAVCLPRRPLFMHALSKQIRKYEDTKITH